MRELLLLVYVRVKPRLSSVIVIIEVFVLGNRLYVALYAVLVLDIGGHQKSSSDK